MAKNQRLSPGQPLFLLHQAVFYTIAEYRLHLKFRHYTVKRKYTEGSQRKRKATQCRLLSVSWYYSR